MDMFEKWNSNVDLAGLQKDIKDAQDNNKEFEAVPHGEYEVKLDKIDGNDFVNHVVTVDFAEATGCRVTDGNHCQWIKCENLRKVKN